MIRLRHKAADWPKWRHNHWPARSVENFVISFPKSGRTWLRVMMAVAEAEARGARKQDVVEEWLANEAPELSGAPVLFTHALSVPAHESSEASGLFLRYIGDRRRLFFVRDPRDVVVSHYFQVSRRARRAPRYVPGAIAEFVRNPDRGLERVLRFYQACAEALRDGNGPSLVLAYEDLHRDPVGGLRAALEFLGAQPSEEAVAAAVDFGRFENMSFKTRRGEVGGYRAYLSEDDIAYAEERIAELQPEALGYREPGLPQSRAAAVAR